MVRALPIVGLAAAVALSGCAGTWDTVSGRSFREKPLGTMKKMWSPEDPVAVLRADPPRGGNDRAQAMLRLKEPLKHGGSREDQNATIDALAKAATADPSPVLRLAAAEALGRFEDERAAGILIVAYNQSHGRPPGTKPPPSPDVVQAGGGRAADRMLISDRELLAGPVGFQSETVAALRCRVLESLGRTSRPEAANFLAHVAAADATSGGPEGAESLEVRLAAVRGLGHCRQPESVHALAQVLTRENGKDLAMVDRSQEGLVRLTGQHLPPDPEKWNEVIRAGRAQVVPEPNWVQQAVGWLVP